jgi:hypothetical protein
VTRQPDEIRAWAEARGGQPARVRAVRPGSADVLRIAFDRLPPHWEALSWEQFLEAFQRAGLAFMYEDEPGSRICKLSKSL